MRFLIFAFCLTMFVAPPALAGVAEQCHAIQTLHRARHGLPAQKLDKGLCDLAEKWARYMASTENMRHGPGRMENIGAGHANSRAMMRTWIASPGHNANLLSQDSTRGGRVGFGAARSRSGYLYWCSIHAASDGGFIRQAAVPGSSNVRERRLNRYRRAWRHRRRRR